MKSWKMLVALVVMLVCGGAMAGDALKPGYFMPKTDVKMKNVDGRMLSLSEIAGKQGTLVIFGCHHCPFFKAWESRIAKIGNDCQKQGIGVMLINANDVAAIPEDGFEFMQKQAQAGGFAFPYVMDDTSDIARAFGATRTPEVFLFDSAGQLAYHGAVDDNTYKPDQVQKHYLQDAIDALVAGKAIELKETASVGCTIKFRTTGETVK